MDREFKKIMTITWAAGVVFAGCNSSTKPEQITDPAIIDSLISADSVILDTVTRRDTVVTDTIRERY